MNRDRQSVGSEHRSSPSSLYSKLFKTAVGLLAVGWFCGFPGVCGAGAGYLLALAIRAGE